MKTSVRRFKFVKTALIWTFLLGVVFISCDKKDSTPPPVIDKTALRDTIAVAQALKDNTVEGTKPGQYVAGTKAPLTTALANASLVYNDAAATQAAVTNAVQQLHAAIDTYRGNLIKEIAATSLIGFWKMNGNANDSSGNGNDGVVTAGHAYFGGGTPTLTADRFARAGMAYHFDQGGNIEVPYKTSLNPQEITISLWARRDSIGRTLNPANCYMVSMNRWNGYKFQTQPTLPFFTVKAIKSNGDTAYYDRDDAGHPVFAGATWHHIVVTFKSGTEVFYLDGTPVKEWTDVPGTPITVDNINLTIGSDLPTSKYTTTTGDFYVNDGGFWTGDLDDVMIYNVALDANQVGLIFTNQNTL